MISRKSRRSSLRRRPTSSFCRRKKKFCAELSRTYYRTRQEKHKKTREIAENGTKLSRNLRKSTRQTQRLRYSMFEAITYIYPTIFFRDTFSNSNLRVPKRQERAPGQKNNMEANSIQSSLSQSSSQSTKSVIDERIVPPYN